MRLLSRRLLAGHPSPVPREHSRRRGQRRSCYDPTCAAALIRRLLIMSPRRLKPRSLSARSIDRRDTKWDEGSPIRALYSIPATSWQHWQDPEPTVRLSWTWPRMFGSRCRGCVYPGLVFHSFGYQARNGPRRAWKSAHNASCPDSRTPTRLPVASGVTSSIRRERKYVVQEDDGATWFSLHASQLTTCGSRPL